MQVIIFPQDNGGVSVIYPAPEYADQIEAVAAKDVPVGKAWRILDTSQLPPAAARDRWRWTPVNSLTVADEVVVVPEEVSRFQAKAALSQAGLLTQANTIVANSGNALLQLAWDEAVSFKRNSPGINALAPALGLNDAALDQLFITAAQIVA